MRMRMMRRMMIVMRIVMMMMSTEGRNTGPVEPLQTQRRLGIP